jgi:hypothetical protein
MAKKLLLKKTANFNNIPEHLIPEMPKQGKTAVFQFIQAIQDPVAGKNGTPVTIYPSDHQFAAISRVRDPQTGEWIAIGMVSREDKDGAPIVEGANRSVLSWRPQERGGYLHITIGNDPVLDQLYQYLMLSPEVDENMVTPDMKDPSIKTIVRYIDYDKKARLEMEAQNLRWEAFKRANELTDSQKQQLAYVLGYNKSHTPDQITAGIRQFAEANPKGFFDKLDDPNAMYKSRILQAIDNGFVEIDADMRVLRWADKSKKEFMKITSTDMNEIQLDYAARCEDPEFVKSIDALLARELNKKK